MMIDQVVQKLIQIPYVKGGTTFSGCDCWGFIELAYLHGLGIELPNRKNIKPGPTGFLKGLKNQTNFVEIDPKDRIDFDIVLLKSVENKRRLFGHCGLVYKKGVLHIDDGIGAVYEKWDSTTMKITRGPIIRHVSRFN